MLKVKLSHNPAKYWINPTIQKPLSGYKWDINDKFPKSIQCYHKPWLQNMCSEMQCALKFRKPIHGLMVCEKYIGVLVAENPNPQFLDSRYDENMSTSICWNNN